MLGKYYGNGKRGTNVLRAAPQLHASLISRVLIILGKRNHVTRVVALSDVVPMLKTNRFQRDTRKEIAVQFLLTARTGILKCKLLGPKTRRNAEKQGSKDFIQITFTSSGMYTSHVRKCPHKKKLHIDTGGFRPLRGSCACV